MEKQIDKEIEDIIIRLNNQYKNISSLNHGEYWRCNLCNLEEKEFSLVRGHHMKHELLEILKQSQKGMIKIEDVNKMIDDAYYNPCFDRKRTSDFNKFISLVNQSLKELGDKK
jgi:hypothetical protein